MSFTQLTFLCLPRVPSLSTTLGYLSPLHREPELHPPPPPASPSPPPPPSSATPAPRLPLTRQRATRPVDPPIQYVVPETDVPYGGLFIAGIPRRSVQEHSLENLWNPLVALGIHHLLPGHNDNDRRHYVLQLLQAPVLHAPWAASYSITLEFTTAFTMGDFPSPFSTPLSFAGRRDPGGVMNPTFTITLIPASSLTLVSPRNELFCLRGPYVASLVDGLDYLSISIIVSHFAALFPNIPFIGLRDFISHRLPRGKKLAAHSAWEPTVLLFAPLERHRDIIDAIRSSTLASPTDPPCFYRLLNTGHAPTSLLQAKDPVMLYFSTHIRAELTLATHTPDLRVLPHPDHGRGYAPYLSAPIGDAHPAAVIGAIGRLIDSGTLSEPWLYFFMDHRRRLFHDIWLLNSLPTHSSHCLYIATTRDPDNLRLVLDDLPPLRLTPLPRHPILSLDNLDNTPLGVLTKAFARRSQLASSPSSTPYDHLSDPSLPLWTSLLLDRPIDNMLGSDRRISHSFPHRPLSSSAPTTLSSVSSVSRYSPLESDPHLDAQPSPSPWGPRDSSLSPASRLPQSALSLSGSAPLPLTLAGPPSWDDKLEQLLDQMSALTSVVASLASRIPPPHPPSNSK